MKPPNTSPRQPLFKSSLQGGKTSSRGLHMSPPAHSLHRDITHESSAAGLGHGHPCRAVAALSLHREFHGRTWRDGTASEMRSPRRIHGLPRAQLLPVDRGDNGGRAPASSGCTSEHKRAVSGRCSSIHRAALMCGVRTGWLPRCQCHVDRRLSCDTGMRHDVSAAGSCSCRSARRQQQHVEAVEQSQWRHLVDCC